MAGIKVKYAGYAIMLLLFSSLLFLALEVTFRFNDQYGRAGFEFDKNLVWRQNPNLKASKRYAQGQVPGKEPFTLRFNNRGFRGEDFRTKKEEGVKRIMVIGDSYTAGLDYPDEEIFTGQLESMLNKRGGGEYDVMNVSAPAWGTDQQYLYWMTEGINYQPDFLILMIAPNDMREMYNKGLLTMDANGELHTKPAEISIKERTGWWLANKSSLFQFVQKKIIHKDYGDFFRIFNLYPVNYGIRDSTDWDMPVYLKDPFPEVEDTYRMFEAVLLEMQESCEQIGAKLLLSKIPIRGEFDGTYDTEALLPDKITNMIDSIAQRNNIPFLNLNEALKQEDDPQKVWMSWEYHFNKAGHDFTAAHLYDFVVENQ